MFLDRLEYFSASAQVKTGSTRLKHIIAAQHVRLRLPAIVLHHKKWMQQVEQVSLTTILLLCTEGDKAVVTMTPRLRVNFDTGKYYYFHWRTHFIST